MTRKQMKKTRKAIAKIRACFDSFLTDSFKLVDGDSEWGSGGAGANARRATKQLEREMKEFRRVSVQEEFRYPEET